ncbi:hypothetical protein ABT324_16675 [Saccharopolyspora sp. NPDC000359]|uniref:hypothetical protein n=1 Tax=Saccharopolyspora sp. NPDC000359 TaxID=3154251 RepID=UPI0033339FE3
MTTSSELRRAKRSSRSGRTELIDMSSSTATARTAPMAEKMVVTMSTPTFLAPGAR